MAAAPKLSQIMPPQELIELMLKGPDLHLCQPQGLMYDQELLTVDLLSKDKSHFFLAPATALLWPKEIGKRDEEMSLLLNRSFQDSDEKRAVLDEVKARLGSITKSSSLIDEVLSVADEFVTNALYNAPYVDPVTFVNQRIDRLTTRVVFPSGKHARLFVAEDGKRLLVGVQDPFGSLSVKEYLNKIVRCYSAGVQNSINFGQGGAGIGSYIIFNAGSSLYYGVIPGQVTMLACVMPYRMSRRQREGLPKHLHWIK
jgi:hypothetical protein